MWKVWTSRLMGGTCHAFLQMTCSGANGLTAMGQTPQIGLTDCQGRRGAFQMIDDLVLQMNISDL